MSRAEAIRAREIGVPLKRSGLSVNPQDLSTKSKRQVHRDGAPGRICKRYDGLLKRNDQNFRVDANPGYKAV